MTDLVDDADRKKLLNSAYRKIKELRTRLAEVELRQDEPVAIVGMGCRLPGGVEDPEAFWRLLSQGLDGTAEIPPDRWNVDDYYDADPEAPNKMYVRRGGFVNHVRGFDPLFFHVSPQEAASMDPQQRLLLEVAWEAIENAGTAPEELAGSQTGVFVGIAGSDFGIIALQALHQGNASSHIAMGISHSIAAGHISYFLGLRGPCMTIDTACSSALAAIHLAIESLRKGESTAALACSANLILLPDGNILCCKAGMLSPDGHCKTFDASANGYSRGEGCAVLVLKLLSRAQADGDRILAVIRGSACNQDGRTNGITAPSGNAQREVIQAALAAARVSPNDVDYVETHGTGTSLGDPIEAHALGEVFAPGRPAGRELVLGAVKSNIGHLEAAAGMAAISKVILALQKGAIPPNLNFNTPSPHIPWDTLPFSVPTRLTPWKAGGPRRLAGVSAFGFSGTNVHIVLEEAPEPPPVAAAADRGYHLLTLSAQTPKALFDLAVRYIGFLAEEPGTNLGDLCFTASAGRNHFTQRVGIVAGTTGELRDMLQRFVDAPDSEPRIVAGRAPTRPPHLGMIIGKVVPTDMHRHLHEHSPAFRDAFDACDTAARELLSLHALSDALTQPSRSPVTEGSPRSRILAFALSYATTKQWLDWGMAPVALAASCTEACVVAVIAGAIGLTDAFRLVADPGAAETTHIEWSRPAIPVFSAATGEPLSASSLRRFAEDVRNGSPAPGRPGQTLARLRQEGVNLVLSIGDEGNAAVKSDLKLVFSNCNDWTDVLEAIAALYVAGAPPVWRRFEAPWPRRRLALPTYPFQRQDCWPNVAPPSPVKPSQREPHHPVLGRRIYAAHFKDDIVFEAELSAEAPALLKDHSYYSTAVVAMTTLLDMALSAGRTCLGDDVILQDVTIEQPLVLSAGQTRIAQTVLTPQAGGGFAFSIVAADLNEAAGASSWRRHCSGEIRKLEAGGASPRADSRGDIPARYEDSVDLNRFYDKVARSGVHYGPSFRLMREVKRGHEGVFAKLALPPELAGSSADFAVHPGLLDSAIQALGLCHAIDDPSSEVQDVYMPVGVERFAMAQYGASEVWCQAILRPRDAGQLDTLNGDITLFARTGEWIGEVTGIKCSRNAKRQLIREIDENRLANWLYRPRWEALPPLDTGAALTGTWLVVAAERGVAAAFSRRIQDGGGRAIFVQEGEWSKRHNAGEYVMPFDIASGYDELLRTVGATECLDGVAYFAGDASVHEEDAAAVPARAKQETRNVLHLVQALIRNGITELGSLALIVRGFEAPSLASPAGVAASALWGFGRVIAAELPELNCKLYDLEPTLAPMDAAGLLAVELASASPENQVALSKSGRAGLRLNRAGTSDPAGSVSTVNKAGGPVQLEIGARGDGSAAAAKAIDPSGSYLITGGLGGLGLACALGLASEGARRIILVGRRPPTDEARTKIEEIERLGTTVVVCSADAGDRAQLEGVLAANLSPTTPLRGIIHAAGLIDDGAIAFQDDARSTQVMTAKIDGAWHLHELTLKMPLDFFVLFASGAGLFGNPGQSSYAAANVFLDNLAAARRASGLPALSIDWGPWAEVGMAARMAERGAKNWESRGLQSITPGEGIAVLHMLLETDRGAQIAVLPMDTSFWRQTASGRTISPFLKNLAATPAQASGAKAADQLALRLRQAEPEARLGILIEIVTEVVSDIFGLERSVPLAADQNLTELGMDSLLALQLSNRLKSMFSVAVPVSLAFQRPTVEAISEHVLEKISSAVEPDCPAAPAADNGPPGVTGAEIASNPASAGDLLANLDQLSDSDIEHLLKTIELGAETA